MAWKSNFLTTCRAWRTTSHLSHLQLEDLHWCSFSLFPQSYHHPDTSCRAAKAGGGASFIYHPWASQRHLVGMLDYMVCHLIQQGSTYKYKLIILYPDCLGWESILISDLSGFQNNCTNIMRNASPCFFHCSSRGFLLASLTFFSNVCTSTHHREEKRTYSRSLHCTWDGA